MTKKFDVIIIGAGAAGMMCAAVAGQRGRRVLVLDHAKKLGEKIRISGGGRCNFTNLDVSAQNFLSQNTRFAISALSGYQPRDFIELLGRYNIDWHEKARGQLFCDGSARQIIDMLDKQMKNAGVDLRLGTHISAVRKTDGGFQVTTTDRVFEADSLVVACGGKSIPKTGATGFGYELAQQFGLAIIDTQAALVPLTFSDADLERFRGLAGIAVPVSVSCRGASFDEDMLFTHRGLSGPAILQISSYWEAGESLTLRLMPSIDFQTEIMAEKQRAGRQAVQTVLAKHLPKRLAQDIAAAFGYDGNIADMSAAHVSKLVAVLQSWKVTPAGSEGYRTAEVTRGGVDTNELNAKTLQAKKVAGLFFVGEVVDVTGWLGGYNFQWAWASGYAAGQVA
ncbi:MAG: NAD(P)/FAD-dependent oxidoreductase [Rhodobacteraceae bacterium]|nr:NAD(P)/FAD-dependent oxidoreductase [Paracoccaceae bacterium]